MARILTLCFCISIFLITGCKNKSNELQQAFLIKTLADQLAVSNQRFTELLIAQNNKMADPYVAVRITDWKSATEKLETKRKEFLNRIETFLKAQTDKDSYSLRAEEAKDISLYLLGTKEFIRNALMVLDFKSKYIEKEALMESVKIDSGFLSNTIAISSADIVGDLFVERFSKFLGSYDLSGLQLLLTCIEINFLNSIYQLLYFVYAQSTFHILNCEKHLPLISMNSSVFESGGSVEITAGIGEFTEIYRPKYFIDGKEVKQDNGNPYVIHKQQASKRKGRHTISFEVEFTEADGTKSHMTKLISYTVK